MELDPIPRAAAGELLAARRGADSISAESAAVAEVISQCAGLPAH